MKLTNTEDIIAFIKNAQKQTPVKVLVQGNLQAGTYEHYQIFGNQPFFIIVGAWKEIQKLLLNNPDIDFYQVENDRANSAIALADYKQFKARIEPGAIIRDHVTIDEQAVIMMGATINIGAVIGAKTMIDMNVVIGGRAIIGQNCHIGAGAVVAGVIEPASAQPVVIGDNVVVGANAVILEGVQVGAGAVVAAGAVVTRDVKPGTVVAGMPAQVIKQKDQQTIDKTKIVDDLREI